MCAASAPGRWRTAGYRTLAVEFQGLRATAGRRFRTKLPLPAAGIEIWRAADGGRAGIGGRAGRGRRGPTLRIPVGSPVLYIRRTTLTERSHPIECAKSVYCGTKYIFYTHLRREQLFS